MNLLSLGSGDIAAELLGSNDSPLLRSIPSSARTCWRGKPNFGRPSTPTYSSRILPGETRPYEALLDGQDDQCLVSGRGEQAGDKHVGVDDRPDHALRRPRFSRR